MLVSSLDWKLDERRRSHSMVAYVFFGILQSTDSFCLLLLLDLLSDVVVILGEEMVMVRFCFLSGSLSVSKLELWF